MKALLEILRALAEPTRLRLIALCTRGGLSVSELVRILGQSQPRISRHLKLLTEAGLLERFQEGTWVFYRLAEDTTKAALIGRVKELIPASDPLLAKDREGLEAVKRERAEKAAAYFAKNAHRWDRLRSLHVDDREVERAIDQLLPASGIGALLDVGTGTGRMLEIFGPRATKAIGVDLSREMLAVARVNLERSGLEHCSVRQADLFQLPFPPGSFDAVTIHQVLHFVDDPKRAIAEAARALAAKGRLLIVDFAPHAEESLRTEHQHRRLGFADQEVTNWLRAAGLVPESTLHLASEPLTVTVWLGSKPATAAEVEPQAHGESGLSHEQSLAAH